MPVNLIIIISSSSSIIAVFYVSFVSYLPGSSGRQHSVCMD